MTKKTKKKVVKNTIDERSALAIRIIESSKITKSDMDLILSTLKKYEK